MVRDPAKEGGEIAVAARWFRSLPDECRPKAAHRMRPRRRLGSDTASRPLTAGRQRLSRTPLARKAPWGAEANQAVSAGAVLPPVGVRANRGRLKHGSQHSVRRGTRD